ncbi:hypothetical protein CR194_01920 [Salipaludibacillus keqinensis]|uniref:Thiamine-binding protein domain-containing protein n=1 Tax=Salipaludibacillus keqinensis TaxID=2045207 RepID=A0A323TK39_9BACI|nr:MTH1187 family thiamine-binding protein [Salipaludibacillus keqinensis]PYZ94314.1 hypothetical protein CR194_01920 [Salipaludibacillus keqinensis]
MVKGLSFQKGVMFLGRKHIACSYHEDGRMKTWLKPITPKTMVMAGKLVFLSMPLWFHLFLIGWLLLIIVPYFFLFAGIEGFSGLPIFSIIYFFFGTHFWFPKELKKYHGAEHKVFSYKGLISARNRTAIKEADITNRYCSTNAVMVYFLLLILTTFMFFSFIDRPFVYLLERATYISLVLWPVTVFWLNRMKPTKVHKVLLNLSYWLQRHITTSEPEELHMKIAIRSFRKLALKEFPSRVIKTRKKKEETFMAIADVTIMPLGSDSTSVSEVVAEIHHMLDQTTLPIQYELTSMSTIIEGQITDLYKILQEIQEVPFKMGHMRVATNIRIDDRRDRPSSIKGKVDSVHKKMASKVEKE